MPVTVPMPIVVTFSAQSAAAECLAKVKLNKSQAREYCTAEVAATLFFPYLQCNYSSRGELFTLYYCLVLYNISSLLMGKRRNSSDIKNNYEF